MVRPQRAYKIGCSFRFRDKGLALRRTWIVLACVLGAAALASGFAVTRRDDTGATQAVASPVEGRTTGVWRAPEGVSQVSIWPHGERAKEDRTEPPESFLTRRTT